MTPLSPELLQALIAVAETGTFTGAGRMLGLRQSTISQRIGRLEAATGRRLLDRDTHRVAMTPQGDALLEHARHVLDAHERMGRHLSGTPLRGRLRFGASEDFVLSALPDVLAAFVRRYPEVDLELTAGLSQNLCTAYEAGLLDILLVKRQAGDRRGVVAWREPISWFAQPGYRVGDGPLPLILYPPPSVTRARTLETLERTRRAWRIGFTSNSLSGLTAAGRAGLGIMPHSARLIPPGLDIVPARAGLPKLPAHEFVVISPIGNNPVAEALTAAILQWGSMGGSAI